MKRKLYVALLLMLVILLTASVALAMEEKIDLSDATVVVELDEAVYTGKKITPKVVSVTVNGNYVSNAWAKASGETSAKTHTVSVTVTAPADDLGYTGSKTVSAEFVIKQADISVTNKRSSYTYTGSDLIDAIKKNISVKFGGKSVEFEVSPGSISDAGSYDLTITPADSENLKSGTVTVSVEKGKVSVDGNNTFTYTGENLKDTIEDSLVVTFDGKEVPFAVSCEESMINVGNYNVTLIPENKNLKEVTKTVTIKNAKISLNVQKEKYTYTGKDQKNDIANDITVLLNGEVLAADKYTVTTEGDTINHGDIKFIFTPKDSNVSGASTTIRIVKARVAVSISKNEYEYTGKDLKNEIQNYLTVKFGNEVLTTDEYTIRVSEGSTTKAGTVTLQIIPNDNYNVYSDYVTVTILPVKLKVTVDKDSYVYTGESLLGEMKSHLHVSYGDGKTTSKYEVTAEPEAVNAGTVKLTVTPTDESLLPASVEVKIVPNDVKASIAKDTYNYTGSDLLEDMKSDITVTFGGRTLTADEYQVAALSNTTDAGDVTLSITPKDTLNLKPTEINTKIVPSEVNAVIKQPAEYIFTGKDLFDLIKNDISVSFLEKEITDYEVECSTPAVDVGEYVFSITPENKNLIPAEVTAKIIKAEITAAVDPAEYVYNGEDQKDAIHKNIKVALKNGGIDLVENEDYTITLPDEATDVGEYAFTVVPVNENLVGDSVPVTASITKYVLNDGFLSLTGRKLDTDNKAVYDGLDQEPVLTVTALGRQLVEGTDYIVEKPEGNIDAGTYTFKVLTDGDGFVSGNYTGSAEISYEIVPFDLANAEITVKPGSVVIYTGVNEAPSLDVNDDMGILLPEDDIQFAVKDSAGNITEPKYPDQYTITVTPGSSNVTGSQTVPYTINYLDAPASPYTFEGVMGNEGWYYKEDVFIVPASGYSILLGDGSIPDASSNWQDKLNQEDGEYTGQTIHLRNGNGEITAEIALEDYKRDTIPPTATVNTSEGNTRVTIADVSDNMSGYIVKLNDKVTEDRNWSFITAGNYTITLEDVAGNGVVEFVFNNRTKTTANNEIFSVWLKDTDGDKLNDNYETIVLKTNPESADTDIDGLNDYDEVTKFHSNPLNVDSDGDGLIDGDEANIYHTNPVAFDSTGDGICDYDRVRLGEIFSYDDCLAMNIMMDNRLNYAENRFDASEAAEKLNELADNDNMNFVKVDGIPYAGVELKIDRMDGRNDKPKDLRKEKNMHFVKVDRENHNLYAFAADYGMLVKFSYSESGKSGSKLGGKLQTEYAYDLKELFGTDLTCLSIVSDDRATIFAMADWNEEAGKAVTDILVMATDSDVVYRIAGSEGCSGFAVSPDGSNLAYLKDGIATVLDLVTGDPLGAYTVPAKLLAYTPDGGLVTELNGSEATVCRVNGEDYVLEESKETFSGVYQLKQPTVNGRSLAHVMDDGSVETIDISGYLSAIDTLQTICYKNTGDENSKPIIIRDFLVSKTK